MKTILRKTASKWWIKILVQNLIGCLPGNLGFRLNEWIVARVKGGVDGRMDFNMRVGLTRDALRLLQDKCSTRIMGLTVLEIGTGWHGLDPLIFYLLGAKKIYTIDHHRHLTFAAIQSKIALFETSSVREMLLPFGDEAVFEYRLRTLKRSAQMHTELHAFLAELGIEYFIRRSCMTTQVPIPEKSVDIFYSSSVLQRIPEADLLANMRHVGRSLLSDNGVFFHLTDQRDVNSLADKDLWHLDYLRYEDRLYNTFISGKFNSQNRLREADFIDVISHSGMHVIYMKSLYREADVSRLRSFRVARRFGHRPLVELAIYHSQLVGHVEKEVRAERSREGVERELIAVRDEALSPSDDPAAA
jgi:hypothetical protein